MKQTIKNVALPLAGVAIAVAGIASAAITPIPNPLPNAVAGNVIKASDINDLAASVTILDARTNIGDLATQADIANISVPVVPVFKDHAVMQTVAENAADGSSFFFKGKEYKAVLSDKGTEKLWLDRNIGASQSCETSTDSLCFGDLYQWGRDKDGHEYVTVTQSEIGQADTITPNDAKFRKGSFDWSTADADGSARTAFLELTDGTGVCPKGWKVPSEAELTAEQAGLGGGNTHFLNLPLAGNHNYSDASVSDLGRVGGLWSSTADADQARFLFIAAGSSAWHTHPRGIGFSLRCVK